MIRRIILCSLIAVSSFATTVTSIAQNIYNEEGGLVVMEAENTASRLRNWITTTQDPELGSYTGSGYMEFTSNQLSGGSPNSPLEYTFKINKAGRYDLYMRSAKDLVEGHSDYSNDCYLRVEGNYDSGRNDIPLAVLQEDTKFFVWEAGIVPLEWSWAMQLEYVDSDGTHKKDTPRYRFEAGETYTIVIHGRSRSFFFDRIVLAHSDVSKRTAQDIALEESSLVDNLPPDPSVPEIVSFTLVNATTDLPVQGFDPIPDNAIINTVDIGTTNLNILANTLPNSDFGSIVFSLSGAEAHNQTESGYPFVLYGDAGSGDYNDNTFDNGTYTLSATPYDDNGGAGNAGETYSIGFTVTDLYSLEITNGQGSGNYSEGEVIDITADAAPAGQVFSVWTGDTSGVADVNSSITTFTMPAADVTLTATYVDQVPVVDSFTITNMDGFENITGDITIDIANGGKQRVAIKANTTPETDFGSVQFSLTGATEGGREDNNPDYVFKSWNHVPGDIYNYGEHTLVITPFDDAGVAGTALTTKITVTNSQLTDYEMWESNNAVVGLASADTDGDLVRNYFEYLYGSDPHDPASKGFYFASEVDPVTEEVQFVWAVSEGHSLGYEYIPEISVDLTSWDTLPSEDYTIEESTIDGITTHTLKLIADYGSGVFLRLSMP
ncbi:MAG: InlB B-repeat-containing protein [Opitutales bacterium]